MYLHIFTDNQLIKTIVKHCEEVSAGNRYVVFAKSPKFSAVDKLEIFSSYKVFRQSGFDINDYKRVFIHYLGGNAVDLVLDNPGYREYYWFFWGADGYALISDLKNVYLPRTRALSNVRKPLKQIIKSRILKILRPVKPRKLKALRKINTCCTFVTGDYELIRASTGGSMKMLSFAYLSTTELFTGDLETVEAPDFSKELRVLIGNSLNPTNNHIESIDFVSSLSPERGIHAVMPISYGGHEGYKNTVKTYANQRLRSVTFIEDFMPYGEYLEKLKNIDIAVFFHIRQQAANNTMSLLWLGKIVVMREESTLFSIFRSWGLSVLGHTEVKNLEDIIKFNDRNPNRLAVNRQVLLRYFSPEAIKANYEAIYAP